MRTCFLRWLLPSGEYPPKTLGWWRKCWSPRQQLAAKIAGTVLRQEPWIYLWHANRFPKITGLIAWWCGLNYGHPCSHVVYRARFASPKGCRPQKMDHGNHWNHYFHPWLDDHRQSRTVLQMEGLAMFSYWYSSRCLFSPHFPCKNASSWGRFSSGCSWLPVRVLIGHVFPMWRQGSWVLPARSAKARWKQRATRYWQVPSSSQISSSFQAKLNSELLQKMHPSIGTVKSCQIH